MNDVRKGAIPPDPWDDIHTGDEVWTPWNVAVKMYKQGKSMKQSKSTLRNKFNYSAKEAKHLWLRLVRVYE